MTLKEFNVLDFEQKRELIRRAGQLLDEKYRDNNNKITIYSVYGFFAEVSYRFDEKVQYIRGFEDIFDCDNYLDNINLIHLN